VPTAQITFQVDVEINYDPFTGKSLEEFSELVHDDLADLLWELRQEETKGFFTTKINSTLVD
jgi:hypothetical protein|tara:strand:+ start:967 stop:1152 length:186 start_codon:yes stop_codon:yes gene_type:complete